MATIVREELELASNFQTFEELENDIEAANSMEGVITAFIDNSSTLNGELWDSVKVKLGDYQAALASIKEVSNILSEAINKALDELMEYISPYDSLDTADIPEIENQIKACEADIERISWQMNSKIAVKSKNKDGEEFSDYVSLAESDPETYAALSTSLRATRELVEELKLQLEKLNGLEEVYARVKEELDIAFASVKGMSSSISRIIPTEEYTYEPVFI